jgi:hypothetical protein
MISSRQSESFGCLGAFQLISSIYNYNNDTMKNFSIKANIWCDNESVVKIINNFKYKNTTLKDLYTPDFDIIGIIIQFQQKQNKKYTNKPTTCKGTPK